MIENQVIGVGINSYIRCVFIGDLNTYWRLNPNGMWYLMYEISDGIDWGFMYEYDQEIHEEIQEFNPEFNSYKLTPL